MFEAIREDIWKLPKGQGATLEYELSRKLTEEEIQTLRRGLGTTGRTLELHLFGNDEEGYTLKVVVHR